LLISQFTPKIHHEQIPLAIAGHAKPGIRVHRIR
jgi:hypothetical protein